MPNLLLTTRCVRACPYCFARRAMADLPEDTFSWENLVYVADFLAAAGERVVSLLGGEPTMHPHFVDFARYLLDRGFQVTVFTSGIQTAERRADVAEVLEGLPRDRFFFVCNLNDPATEPPPPEHAVALDAFLRLAGPWTGPGFNVFREDFDLAFLVDAINRYGLRRSLRLGVAHPLPGQTGPFLSPEAMPRVAARLHGFRELLDRYRIKPGLDCGFPLCSFTDEQLGWLNRLSGEARFGCGPALDITPDMRVFACFPLSCFEPRSLFEFDSYPELVEHHQRLVQTIRAEMAGVYDDCDGCPARSESLCAGGGACHLLHRMVGEEPVRIKEIVHALARAGLPL